MGRKSPRGSSGAGAHGRRALSSAGSGSGRKPSQSVQVYPRLGYHVTDSFPPTWASGGSQGRTHSRWWGGHSRCSGSCLAPAPHPPSRLSRGHTDLLDNSNPLLPVRSAPASPTDVGGHNPTCAAPGTGRGPFKQTRLQAPGTVGQAFRAKPIQPLPWPRSPASPQPGAPVAMQQVHQIPDPGAAPPRHWAGPGPGTPPSQHTGRPTQK